MAAYRRYKVDRIFVAAADAQEFQRDLVQKTLTQMFEYNLENAKGAYTLPTIRLEEAKKNHQWLT